MLLEARRVNEQDGALLAGMPAVAPSTAMKIVEEEMGPGCHASKTTTRV